MTHIKRPTDAEGLPVRVKRPERRQLQWRDAVDPRILLALRMFATMEGVGSELETDVNFPSLAQRAGEEVFPARQSWNFSSPACS